MFSTRSVMLLSTALSALLVPALAVPAPAPQQSGGSGSSGYWLANIKHQGTVWGNSNSTSGNYEIFRTAPAPSGGDDSDAIQKLLEDGGRCGSMCNSSTTTPAIIYIPGGTYQLNKPLNLTYYTQIIGDATNRPVFKPGPTFAGMAMMDADPYANPNNTNWFINQNNFFRQIRNVKFDLRGSANTTTAIHWQVAQATSLQNIDFEMDEGSGQQGIFMDNGSGGWCSDLTFSGGGNCMFVGSQQFTSRNLKFTNCGTAIFMNWNWGWTFNNISIEGGSGQTGMDMSVNPANQSVGSVVLSDSKVSGVEYGVKTSYGGNGTGNVPATGGTLLLINVDFAGTQNAVYQVPQTKTILEGNKIVDHWAQGNSYVGNGKQQISAGPISNAPKLPQSLTTQNGAVYGRSKPQYEDVAASNFISALDSGLKGDGQTDDTKAMQDFLNKVASTPGAIAFFDHAAYLIKDTVIIPQKIKIVGEIWSLIVADGDSFNDATKPKPVWQVGKRNTQEKGAVEISDLIFETKGAAPGAVMIEWNLNSAQGESGMWDSHVRIGGSAETELLMEQCRGHTGKVGYPGEVNPPKVECQGVFMMFHATKQSGGFVLENDWFWVADHDLEDGPGQTQINIYSARGALFQNQGPCWLWGTASEHSILYNYQLDGVKAFFGGFMQTETPYFQPSPEVPKPFNFNQAAGYQNDPTFDICVNGTDADGVPCKDAWGLRVLNSQNVHIYSVGMYSFFNGYNQACVWTQSCQENVIRVQNSQIYMYAVTTKAAVNMLRVDANAPIVAKENKGVYGDTIAYFFSK
ncbi:hypothetical protein PRZ48_004020 [Zasmidium cellare]|uniref:Rhamnogalacturonase A/B/Epimerase-like pectate lyase domain-containing protein n=1 Tax=Zasmidium cellare TaxID=395010 RepID=A0ABR0EYA5_ZASCE|nr:hypothetical protein PRZ48_004020 [Zasmidium cellare]